MSKFKPGDLVYIHWNTHNTAMQRANFGLGEIVECSLTGCKVQILNGGPRHGEYRNFFQESLHHLDEIVFNV
jgi:hypothetical protein